MSKKIITKSLQRSIDKALARSARWEARGRGYLALGQWRKAIDAFERRLWWVTWADGVRRRGTVWIDPFDPAHAEWRDSSPCATPTIDGPNLSDLEALPAPDTGPAGPQLELFPMPTPAIIGIPPTVQDERCSPPNERSRLAIRRFTNEDIHSFVLNCTGRVLRKLMEYRRLPGEEGKCDAMDYSPRNNTVFVFRTCGCNSLDGQPLFVRITLDIALRLWIPSRRQLQQAPDAQDLLRLLAHYYSRETIPTRPDDKYPQLPAYITTSPGYLRAAEHIIKRSSEETRRQVVTDLQVDVERLSPGLMKRDLIINNQSYHK